MLITKYTAILLESARSSEARNMAVSRSDAWSSSLDSSTGGRRPVRRRHFVYSRRVVHVMYFYYSQHKPDRIKFAQNDDQSQRTLGIHRMHRCSGIKGSK
ncbi:hypothetical protein HW555_003125 [Spodoptera exigua]|uniref:Uncharacterized protein n=1 Tax=Spodoptera exigua TaxID=7107 RepID=A0A835L8T7_SPOEX|nr:hypothetical protein HW555_003125 [Spodoptera exigua]